MENHQEQMGALNNLVMIVVGVVLSALLFSHCGDDNKQQSKTVLGTELKRQYYGLQTEYIRLKKYNDKINKELELKFIELSVANNKVVVEHKKYISAYHKGRGDMIANPNNDSLHLAAYDSLNANCERVQDYNDNRFDKYEELVNTMQRKVKNQDSTITNRDNVIALDKISIALTRDSLQKATKTNRKRVIKAFLIGVGVGVAAREAVGVAIKFIH